MRLLFCLLFFQCFVVRAQRLDPDQNPHWTRFTFVENSDALVPLRGDYQVYYIQSGMWWNMLPLKYPVRVLPEEGMRLAPVFGSGFPAFKATPARGRDLPDVKVVVVRERDTMVVELSVYLRGNGVYEPPATAGPVRRSPVVLPFRPGRYIITGRPFTAEYPLDLDEEDPLDARTVALRAQFDALWQKALATDHVVPQLNTDTCRQELLVPADLDLPETPYRDVWVLRSGYCGKHFVHFPMWGTRSAYTITFNPHFPEEKKDPVILDTSALDDVNYWLDVSDWPIGDHDVNLISDGNGGTFTLKMR